MPDSVLWDLDMHTAAKHRVLRSYLDGWIPVMAQQALRVAALSIGPPRLLIVDGFAGAGRYATGEQRSPLDHARRALDACDVSRLQAVHFIFLSIEHDAASRSPNGGGRRARCSSGERRPSASQATARSGV